MLEEDAEGSCLTVEESGMSRKEPGDHAVIVATRLSGT